MANLRTLCFSIAVFSLLSGPALSSDEPCGPEDYSLSKFPSGELVLPQRYCGHDPFALAAAAEKYLGQLEKDEFETEHEHKARAARVKAAPLLDDLHRENLFAIQVTPSDIQYDAEREVFVVKLARLTPPLLARDAHSRRKTSKILLSSLEGIEIGKRQTDRGTSTAQNAFGASTTVLKVDIHALWLLFWEVPKSWYVEETRKHESINYSYKVRMLAFEIKVEREDARAVKAGLRGLVLTSLHEWAIATASWTMEPTFDAPISGEAVTQALIGNALEKVIFYDFPSGKIFDSSPLAGKK